MKRLLLLSVSMLFVLNAFSQKISESEVPASVLKMYKTKLSDSVATKWEKHDNFYTARFTKSNLKASMVFAENSEWIWTRWEVDAQYLPKKVKEYITANYPKYKIASSVIEYKPGGEFYLVGLKLKKDLPVLRFTIKSEFMGKEEQAPKENNTK